MSLPPVLCNDSVAAPLAPLLARYGLQVAPVPPAEPIPGSFWGDSEAGLVGNTLYLRHDTPLHSALHEASHYICMSPPRRSDLHRPLASRLRYRLHGRQQRSTPRCFRVSASTHPPVLRFRIRARHDPTVPAGCDTT